jgi:copper transporter 1
MVFTWSSENLCIIFRWWRITGPLSFLLSLVLIVLLTAGYEGVRSVTRKYEAAHNQQLNSFPVTSATGGGRSSISLFVGSYTGMGTT